MERLKDLDERVGKFFVLKLPGQPQVMHVGTSNLIAELDGRRRFLESQIDKVRSGLSTIRALPASENIAPHLETLEHILRGEGE